MSRKTVKTLFYEICASLLLAAALAGFNLVASERPEAARLDNEDGSLQLLAHGRGHGGRGGRHSGRRGQRRHRTNQPNQGNVAPTNAQPVEPPQPQGQAPQTQPTTQPERPEVR